MAEHTPGPWTLEAGRNFITPDGEFYLSYGKDKHGNPKFKNFCALDANARLIAAAPELLKESECNRRVMSEVLAVYEHLAGTEDEPAWYQDIQDAHDRTSAAIAKAKGQA
jgi:hypothetical protein